MANIMESTTPGLPNISPSLEPEKAALNHIAYDYIMPVLLSTGVITNILNVFVLRSLRAMKQQKNKDAKTTYTYLLWLAVGQVLSCISIIPSLINLDRRSVSYGWAFYYAHFEIIVVNSIASACIYIIVGLSVDRFVAVCKPHSYKSINGDRIVLIRVVASFMVPPILYTPLCFFQKVRISQNRTGYTPANNPAVTDESFWQFWNFTVEICHRLVPAIIILFLNLCIICEYRRLKGMKKKLEPQKQLTGSNQQNKVPERHDLKLYLLLMGVIIVFLITTLPSAFLGVLDHFGHQDASLQFEIFRAVANLLEVLGFSLNFFLYFFLVSEVQKKLFSVANVCYREP